MNGAEPLEQSSPTPAGHNMPLSAAEEGPTGPTEQPHHTAGPDTEMVDRDQGYSEPAAAAAAAEEVAAADAAEQQPEAAAPATSMPAYVQKHPLPEPVAVSRPAAQVPTSPSSDSDTGPARSGPKRKQVFPKTRASERCGKCENCLNPQRKKACMEVRRRQEEMLKQQQLGGGAAQQQRTGSTASSAAPKAAATTAKPAAAGSAAPSDPFTQKVQAILAPNGGVRDTKHVNTLLQLLQSAKGMHQRITLLAVLQRSAPEVLSAAVRGRALLALQTWLTEFVAAQKSGPAGKVLNCLAKLPITTAALKPPCELGKVVGKLRKDESLDAATKEQAKALVAKWKHIVESESNREPAAGTAAKAQPAGGNHAAAAKPAAVAAASSKPAAAAKPAAFAAVADDDMFGAADKQRASLKEAAAKEAAAKEAAAQRHKVIRLEVDVPRGRAGSGGTDQPASPSGAANNAGKAPGTAAAATAGVSSASTSPFEGLGDFTAGVSMIGGATGNLTLLRVGAVHQSAAERAAAAARRVPSPEPPAEPRREKRKKVVWVDDGTLAAVRWFYKVDPPAAAKKDADLSQAPGEASGSEPEREASPPGFETAAKREHLSEAQVLRAHRLQEDEERHELEERLVRMVASLAWTDPPAMAAASAAAGMEYGVARGEESSEAAAQATRRAQCVPVAYPSLAATPPTPEEPQNPADAGIIMSPARIPRIPLSLEEAAALQDQQQHHMQSMQQQQQQQQPTLQAGPGLQAPPQQQGLPLGGQPQVQQHQQQQFVGVPGGQGIMMQGGQLLMQQGQPLQQGGMLAASLPMSLPQQPQQQLGIASGAPPSGQMALQLNTDALAQLASSGLLLLPQQGPSQQQQQPQAVGSMGLAMPQQPGAQVQYMQLGPGQQMQLGPGQLAGPALPQPQRQEQQAWQQQQQPPQQQGHSQQAQQQQQWQPQQRQQQQGGQAPQRGGYQGHQPRRPPPQQQEGPPRGGGRPNIPCKFFNQPGGCRKGDSCGFAHIPRQGGAPKRGRGEDDGGPGGSQFSKQPRTWDNRGPRGGH